MLSGNALRLLRTTSVLYWSRQRSLQCQLRWLTRRPVLRIFQLRFLHLQQNNRRHSTHDLLDRVADGPVAVRRRGRTIQTVQRTVKCPQCQRLERVVHVPLAIQRQGPTIRLYRSVVSERGARMMISSCGEPLSSSGPPRSATFPDEGHSSVQVFTESSCGEEQFKISWADRPTRVADARMRGWIHLLGLPRSLVDNRRRIG